ncbi:hypothetical protein TELCIR_02636 [Teladorsagia circumcincta]|uniref:Uncharacterized protein n=1 Tax=Teladorsagia circumcincta TaxID=45464 RepID=A0A2G9UYP8_TELCI|nr:hypothetical protein TELCIR_02636 [Teladorsagia circumcincta]
MFPGALLTSGQIVYFGCPTQMMQYFTSIDFPCPKFKNPCDFYVDLATHDHQSPAASAESSARIAKLIQCWEPLKSTPPQVTKSSVSPMLSRPSMIDSIEAVYRRNWYELMNEPLRSLREPLMALLMSGIIGTAFFSMTRQKRAAASDRIADEQKRTAFEMLRKAGVSTILFINLEFLWDLPLLTLTAALYSLPVPFLTGSSIMEAAFGASVNSSELTIGCQRREVLAKMIMDDSDERTS